MCKELLITKLIKSSVFHPDIFIYVFGNMLVCCISSKAYFILEQIANTLKNFFNVARSEEFFIYFVSLWYLLCFMLSTSEVDTHFTCMIFVEYLAGL